MSTIPIGDVASYFIWRANQDEEFGDNITNLKLQKLVYYAQGFHLALFDEPLFEEPIEAWAHGPVVPELYQIYRDHKANPIPTPEEFDPEVIEEAVRSLLEDVFGVYGQYSAWGLRNLTHQESPWTDTPRNGVITHDIMREFFRGNLVNV